MSRLAKGVVIVLFLLAIASVCDQTAYAEGGFRLYGKVTVKRNGKSVPSETLTVHIKFQVGVDVWKEVCTATVNKLGQWWYDFPDSAIGVYKANVTYNKLKWAVSDDSPTVYAKYNESKRRKQYCVRIPALRFKDDGPPEP